MTRNPASRFGLDAGIPRRLIAWGLLVWFVVAVSVRLTGHLLLDPAQPAVVAGFFVLVVPLMALVTYPVYRVLHIDRRDRPTAAAMMSIPGMFLDVGLVLGADRWLPAMSTEMVVTFGAVLLFGYAVVLLTGFVPLPRPETAGTASHPPATPE